MAEVSDNRIMVTHGTDNVGVVVVGEGLAKGVLLPDGVQVKRTVPVGQKLALKTIKKGEPVIRYGEVIGHALGVIEAGTPIDISMLDLPVPPDLDSIPLPGNRTSQIEPLEGYTFMGYLNPDGSVGTRNLLGISTSVQCVAGFARHMEQRIRSELLPNYPAVDGVVSMNHAYGCGIAIDAPDSEIPTRTLRNLITNPNFGGEVLLIGLGCEKLQPEELIPGGRVEGSNTFCMQDVSFPGFESMEKQVLSMARSHLERLNRRRRTECPASDLVVGMQCGGSDSFSGITSNPVAGFASDLIVRAGGSVMFSEVTEVRDAVHLLIPRAANEEVGKALLEQMKWYDRYLERGNVDRSANPSPGNREGGLSNVVEKALGSIAKSGSTPIVDVIGPGEKVRKKGLTFAATPANDFVCGTLQLSAGMNSHVFMTGRGTPYNLSLVPVLKVSSNSVLGNRWSDLIDLDAGKIAVGKQTIEEAGWELFRLILETASGTRTTAGDKLGLFNDLALFNPGPLT